MNKELFISSTPHETKVAVVEDDQLAEIYFERENEYTLAGSIYKGRVTRVLPGMQSAFVDIGLERDAFLYVTDFLEESEEQDEDIEPLPASPARGEGRSQRGYARSAAESSGGFAPHAEPEIQPHLIEPAAGPAPLEDEEVAADAGEGEEPGAGAAEDGGEEGVRRWRGRRRARGRRGRFEPRENGGQEDSQAARPAEAGPAPEASPESHAERAEPREPEVRERDSRERDFRNRGRDSFGPPRGFQPIVLPGESIAKYTGRPEPGAAADSRPDSDARERGPAPSAPARPSIPSFLTRRPSTEVRDITAVQEVRAKDTRRQQNEELRVERPPVPPEPVEEPILARAVVSEPAAEYREEAPPEPVPAAPAAEIAVHPVAAEETEREREKAAQRYAAMNLAGVFGGEETEADEQPPAEAVASPAEFSREAQPAEPVREAEERAEHGSMADTGAAAETAFAPGEGHVEEEEIEDEEAELASHPGAGLEEDEFEELEEEVLDRIAEDQHQSRVQQLAEAAEESGVVQESAPVEPAENGEVEEGAEYVLSDEIEPGEEPLGEEEAGNGNARAEMRAAPGTANFQQQRPERSERPGWDRRRGRGGRRGPRRGGPVGRRETHRTPLIADLLKEGQEILVQIAKEPIGKKGARITSHIALPGRFLVYMPTVNHIGVSRKISSDEERQRLKRIVISERENGQGGFIVRTAADRAPEDELRADIRFLKNLWHEIKQRSEQGKAPALIYHDLNLVERILRDQVNENFTSIWVDTESDYERMLRFVNRFQPALVKRVKLYSKETPLFEQFNVQEEINKALKSKVWLKSGGYIVINQTEALVAIDVNTGKYVGKTARLEDTIVKTNVDAIKEIVRQVRLRDLGGIIIIDFIDMDERRNRQKVMQALEEALRTDRAPSKVLQFNDFGLVAITRKRVKQSLERMLGAPCSYCTGTGFVKSVSTVCNEIWVEMKKMSKHFDRADIMLRVHPEVAKALKTGGGRWIQEIEELTGRNLIVKTDPLLHQEQFDIN